MKYLAHRGKWRSAEEQNTHGALSGAIALGFGIETDLRDSSGKVVISHEPCQSSNALLLKDVFEIKGIRSHLLALNIKSTGLAPSLKNLLEGKDIDNYFFFDMSVPEAFVYWKNGLKFYTRQSEFEGEPSLYQPANGVWIDCFEREWLDSRILIGHLERGKDIALVSPELHKRDPLPFWRWLKQQGVTHLEKLALCTDRPEEARTFFGDSN